MMKPIRSILVVGVQRSGTSLLCEAIKSVGLAGIPEEYFLKIVEPHWMETRGDADVRSYINEAIVKGTSANGVFGAKIMWNTFCDLVRIAKELPELSMRHEREVIDALFGDTTYIWIRRRDKVRQAVSWAKAAQTGIFSSLQTLAKEEQQLPEYNYELVNNLHLLIQEGEIGWGSYFGDIGANAIEVFYEDLTNNLDGTLETIMSACGIIKEQTILDSEIRNIKHSDRVNDEWVAKYNETQRA